MLSRRPTARSKVLNASRWAALRAVQLMALLALLAYARPACAGQWQGFLALSSDNVYRGLTQNAGDPALLGDLHWRSEPGWFAGLGLATVNLNPGAGSPLEIAAYAGRAAPLSAAISGRFTLVHYEYPREQRSLHYGYDEILAALAWRDRAYLNLSYSPNTSRFTFQAIAVHKPAWSAELVARQPLGRLWGSDWEARAGLGRYEMTAPINRSYQYWNITLASTRGPWQLELAAIGTDAAARKLFGYPRAGSRWVVTLLRRYSGRP